MNEGNNEKGVVNVFILNNDVFLQIKLYFYEDYMVIYNYYGINLSAKG